VPYLLNLFYLLLLLLTLPWFLWQAVRKGKYRAGYAAKLLGLVPRRTGDKTCLWLHAVSVGEVNLLAPLLAIIAQERPDWECVISTTTATGMALGKRKYPQFTVFYCPLDFSWAVRESMRRVRPDLLVLAELELWPNLIRAAKEAGAKTAIINGRLGEKSFRGYKLIRPFVASVLKNLDLLAVQDETYAGRFQALGARPETIHVTGSIKYDGVRTERRNPDTQRLAGLAGFASDDIIFLAGSTQEPEEAMALETFRALSPQWPQLRLVLAPRHPERFPAVAKLLERSGFAWRRRTALKEPTAEEHYHCPNTASKIPEPRILLIDVLGELAAWWGTARIAFVGGSMGSRGGQNMLEAAAYGAAVSFGPNTWNFHDIVSAMLAHQAAVVVHDQAELTAFVRRCLEQPDFADDLGRRAQQLVRSRQGADMRTWQLLFHLLASH